MTKQDKVDILKGLAALALAFEKEPSEQRNNLYLDNLKDLPVQPVLNAIRRALHTCKFFPSIAELRELAGSGEDEQSLEDEAVMAWDELRGCTSIRYNPAALENPITRRCFEALGGKSETLSGFAMWDYDQEQWKRKEFLSLYQAYARSRSQQHALTHEESTDVLNRIGFGGLTHEA